MYQKFGSKIKFVGFENHTQKISEQSTLRWIKTFILTNTLFRHMRRRAVIFGAEYFYYADSNIHETLSFGYVMKELSENVYFYPLPTFCF